jgi:hypothetical protein
MKNPLNELLTKKKDAAEDKDITVLSRDYKKSKDVSLQSLISELDSEHIEQYHGSINAYGEVFNKMNESFEESADWTYGIVLKTMYIYNSGHYMVPIIRINSKYDDAPTLKEVEENFVGHFVDNKNKTVVLINNEKEE